MAISGMVHALQRAGQHLISDGVLVCMQPRHLKRPFIAITASGRRQPVARLINPKFEPYYSAAEAAIREVVEERQFDLIGRTNHQFRVCVANPAELHRYLQGPRPPHFPPGGQKRLQELWRSRPEGAEIEVTEFLSVFGLRVSRPT
jgi:hypothetical protein